MLYQSVYYLPCLAGILTAYWLFCRNDSTRRAWFLALASPAALIVFLVSSVTFEYAVGSTAGLLILSTLVYWVGQRIRRAQAGYVLAVAILLPLSVLLATKYMIPLAEHFGLIGMIIVPLGVSYFTFKHISYLIECRRGKFEDAGLGEYLSYIFFFPMFAAGPIERFGPFLENLRNVQPRLDQFSMAAERIVIGLIMKFVVAEFLIAALMAPGQAVPGMAASVTWYQGLYASFLRFLYTYFDFAGYTSMVIGTGLLFGIKLMENFNLPLLRPNIAEFWRNWHMSLSGWARDYIYFPVMGTTRNVTIALLATFLMIGVWHSPAPGWALWGLHHGVGLAAIGIFQRRAGRSAALQAIRRMPVWRLAGVIATWWYVSMGYALTFDPYHLGASIDLYLKIFTFGMLS